MSETTAIYVTANTNGGWRIVDSRVSLDSVVCAYWEGKTPEAIAEEYPSLSVEQVFGAIAFYLHNQREIDDYLTHQDARWRDLAAQSALRNGELLRRLRKDRRFGTLE